MKTPTFLILLLVKFLNSKGEDIDCPPEGIAYLPHHDCNKYIICLNSVATEMSCPLTLYFNPETKQCDFPENVLGCRGGTRPPIGTSSTTEDPTTYPPPPGTLTECGQTILADDGFVQYKLNQFYDTGELCIFIIRFESGFKNSTITLVSNGFSDIDPNAVTLFRIFNGVSTTAQHLGRQQQTVIISGHGVVIIFKTNSETGTGFQLSFEVENPLLNPRPDLGTDLVLTNEIASPLPTPFLSANMTKVHHSYYIFTSASKLVTDPGTYLRLNLTIVGNMGNPANSCLNVFHMYCFDEELIMEKTICRDFESDRIYDFKTRGFLIAYQKQEPHLPTHTTGIFTWKTG